MLLLYLLNLLSWCFYRCSFIIIKHVLLLYAVIVYAVKQLNAHHLVVSSNIAFGCLVRSWIQQSELHSWRTMQNFRGFNIDHLLWMLDAAMTRQNEKQKAAILKITENKVLYFMLWKLCDIHDLLVQLIELYALITLRLIYVIIKFQWCSQGQNLRPRPHPSIKAKAWTFEAKAIVPRPLSIRLPQKLRYAVRLTAWQDR